LSLVAKRWLEVALVPASLVLGVLVLGSLAHNLALLDTGPERLPPTPALFGLGSGGGSGAPAAFGSGDFWRALALVAMWITIAAGVLAAVIYKLRGGKLLQLVSVWELLGYLLVLLLFFVILLHWQDISAVIRGDRGVLPSIPSGPAGPGSPSDADADAATGTAILAVALLAFVAVSLAIPLARFLRRMAAEAPPKGPPSGEMARAVARAVRTIREGGDYREAVIQCYSDLMAALASRGVQGQEPLTAREIEGVALQRVGLTRGSVDALTGLFEEARYSKHDIGPAQRDAAVTALEAIRRELEVSSRASA
jgi:hypothetical protein